MNGCQKAYICWNHFGVDQVKCDFYEPDASDTILCTWFRSNYNDEKDVKVAFCTSPKARKNADENSII